MRALRRTLPGFVAPLLARRLRSTGKRPRVSPSRSISASAESGLVTRVNLPIPHATERLGTLLGASPLPGSVILLHGDLGAGKTSFARGFVRAAVRNPSVEVTSPTFLLANEYPVPDEGDLKVFHMDLWRLKDASSRSIVDFDDVFENHVSLIEWPDRLGTITPAERLDVTLEYVDAPVTESNPWGFADNDDGESGTDGRVAEIVARSAFWEERVKLVAKQLRDLERGMQET